MRRKAIKLGVDGMDGEILEFRDRFRRIKRRAVIFGSWIAVVVVVVVLMKWEL